LFLVTDRFPSVKVVVPAEIVPDARRMAILPDAVLAPVRVGLHVTVRGHATGPWRPGWTDPSTRYP
jgi:hypothetical protein